MDLLQKILYTIIVIIILDSFIGLLNLRVLINDKYYISNKLQRKESIELKYKIRNFINISLSIIILLFYIYNIIFLTEFCISTILNIILYVLVEDNIKSEIKKMRILYLFIIIIWLPHLINLLKIILK